jgi:hypothetical protein
MVRWRFRPITLTSSAIDRSLLAQTDHQPPVNPQSTRIEMTSKGLSICAGLHPPVLQAVVSIWSASPTMSSCRPRVRELIPGSLCGRYRGKKQMGRHSTFSLPPEYPRLKCKGRQGLSCRRSPRASVGGIIGCVSPGSNTSAVDVGLDPLAAAGPIGNYLSYAGTNAGFIDARSRHLQHLDALELAALRGVSHLAQQAEIDEARGTATSPYIAACCIRRLPALCASY